MQGSLRQAGGYKKPGYAHEYLHKEEQEHPYTIGVVLMCILKTEPHDGGKAPGKSGAWNGRIGKKTGTRGNGMVLFFGGEKGRIGQDQNQYQQEDPVQYPVRIIAGFTVCRFQDSLMNRSCPSCRTAGRTRWWYHRRTRGWCRHSSPYCQTGRSRQTGSGG